MEKRDFRISREIREALGLWTPVFTTDQDPTLFFQEAQDIAYRYNEKAKREGRTDFLSAGKLNAAAILHMMYQEVLSICIRNGHLDFFQRRLRALAGNDDLESALAYYDENYPSPLLEEEKAEGLYKDEETARGYFIYQVMKNNPCLMKDVGEVISPESFQTPSSFKALSSILSSYVKDESRNGQELLESEDFFTILTKPARMYPDSITDQIRFVMKDWAHMLPESLTSLMQSSIDYIREEEKDYGMPGAAPGPMPVTDYSGEANEYEAFSDDLDWMPRVVMIAKCTLVWLDQLSREYGRKITTLDLIPDRELDLMRERGITALWLIGLWNRSDASREIKHLCGNPEAEASAYSLIDYDISETIGGWPAVEDLSRRCEARGIRLASDMVPNHTGIDGSWVYDHPEYYISQDKPPFPSYTYTGPDLSNNPDYEIRLEDHYYDRTDAAVTFELYEKKTGVRKYIFHGNDGTSMPWNDTAQLDYLNPETREAVIEKIIHVARHFHIIRFDAAMTLAKRHIQRLWYPKPGEGGDNIAGRASHSMPDKEFEKHIPEEFWREVVDRIQEEVPDTLLLAEAFWMMEGYFVRTLGMHRVYNSAFMNMIKNEENQKYREGIRNTLVFEPEILKRYVNFMNNPDEETAINQFGDGEKYFGVCTLMSTLPGLPMIGHGQIEGYHEKYGMEYSRAYWNESPNGWLIDEHYRKIFPLLRKRYLFSGVEHFNLYDLVCHDHVEESVYAYVNGHNNERNLVLYNNQYESVWGTIRNSCPKKVKGTENGETETTGLAENLGLSFKSRRYMIYECFNDGLTYIRPSIKVYEEGLQFKLDGYESRVYWNIREVVDNDGTYDILWKVYGEHGLSNIRTAILMIRMKNMFDLYEPLRDRKFLQALKDITAGKGSMYIERYVLLQLAEIYSKIPEVYEELDDVSKDILGEFHDIDAKKMISQFKRLSSLFRNEDVKVMRAWNGMDAFLPLMISMALALRPFTDGKSVMEIMTLADSIPLAFFFQDEAQRIGLGDNDTRLVAHAASIFIGIKDMFDFDEIQDTDEILRRILMDEGIRDFAGLNEYQNVIWYNKEKVQLLILIAAFALGVRHYDNGFKPDTFVNRLFEKESMSKYRLNELIE